MTVINIGRGRRKPKAAKELGGTIRKHRSKGTGVKVESAALPRPPKHLNPHERNAWRRLAELVDPLGICAPSDVVAFEQLAICLGMIYRARDELQRKHGGETTYSVVTESGTVVRPLPQVEIVAKFEKILDGKLAKFGLAPADRERVAAIADDSVDDPLDEFAVGGPDTR